MPLLSILYLKAYTAILSDLDGSLNTSIFPILTLGVSVFFLVVVGEVANTYLRD